MRVLQVVADGGVGGGSTHVLQLLRGFHHNFECGIVTQQGSYLSEQAASLGVPVFQINFFASRLDPRVSFRLAQIVTRFHPDLIHAHGGRAGFFLASVPPRVPFIYTVHGLHCVHKRQPVRALAGCAERLAMRRAAHVIFVAEHDLERASAMRLLRRYGGCSVVYNGIAIRDIPRATNPLWDVGFIGRFTRQKDPMLFLRAMLLLPQCRAVMVGDGDLGSTVRRAVQEWNLADRVDMKGSLPREETLAILSRLKVLAMTSRWEGLSILVLEAMAAGVPVVAPAIGGLEEPLQGNRGGLLVPRTPEDVAQGVAQILCQPDLAARLVESGRQHLMEKFTEDAMLGRLRDLYEDVLFHAGQVRRGLLPKSARGNTWKSIGRC